MFAVIHGPLVGYNNDGSVALVLDARAMYQKPKPPALRVTSTSRSIGRNRRLHKSDGHCWF